MFSYWKYSYRKKTFQKSMTYKTWKDLCRNLYWLYLPCSQRATVKSTLYAVKKWSWVLAHKEGTKNACRRYLMYYFKLLQKSHMYSRFFIAQFFMVLENLTSGDLI